MSVAFTTARLVAEPLAARHAAELATLHGDERVMATMGGGTATFEESAAWLERNLVHAGEPGCGVFVFREHATGRFVGRGVVRRIEIGGAEEVEVGYAVAAELWGRGLATEMAEGLVAHAEAGGHADLVAYTEPANAASRRVMEKVGFAYDRDVEHHGRRQVLYRRSAPR
ncbi:MAG TPA: GNAT family N-acetyltransferase [Gaiellaceae bacterium]|nr:GNAT family N-acetyltransferase [Gaiellaceae bacterium]